MTNKFILCHEYPLFSELGEREMNAILQFCREECFYPGYTLFEEGEPAEKLYCLVEGEVEVFFVLGEAGLIKVDRVLPGEVFGCSALAPPYVYTCTTQAKTRIEVLELDALGLRELFDADSRIAASIQQRVIQCLLSHIVDLQIG